jgi:hypothetical protein
MTTTQREGELSTAQWLLLGALVLALLVLSAWGVYATLTGVNSILIWDFHAPWTALRAMLLEGADPYSPEVLGTIQEQMLGRAALPGEDQCAFAYPLYILVLIGPLVYLPLPVAQAIWLAVILASFLIFALLAPRAVGWYPPTWLLVLTLLLALGLYSTVWAIWLGQISIVVAAVTAVAWWGVRTRRWALAGVCLALSTIKPQMVFLFVPAVLLWASCRRHWRLVIAFVIAFAALILTPTLWLPDWPLAWMNALRHYTGYSIYEPTLVMLFSSTWLAYGLAALLLAWIAYRWRWAEQREAAVLNWAMSMLLVTTALIAPRTSHINQLVLLLPLFFVFSKVTRPGVIVAVGLALLIGPWALDALLSPAFNSPEYLLWQHRVISPILPLGLTIALLVLSPRVARGDLR